MRTWRPDLATPHCGVRGTGCRLLVARQQRAHCQGGCNCRPDVAKVYPRRMVAELDGDFVVFLFGLRINKPWKVHQWLPVFLAMPRMLKELYAHPECGFLGHESCGFMLVQYWRSFEHLEAYARSKDHRHWPA